MLNKRIKSLLVAGLLILGMSGQSFAAETKSANLEVTTIDNNVVEYDQDGIKIDIVNITGNAIPEATKDPANYDGNGQYIGPYYEETTYHFSVTWDPSKIKAVGSEIGYLDASTAQDKYLELSIDNENGKAVLTRTFVPGSVINFVDLGYELIDNDEEEQEEQESVSYVESIIKKYKESMESLGKVSDDGSFRHIDKSYGINQDDWNDFITDFNDKTDKNNGMRIEYDAKDNVYVVIENINNTIVERIQIEFIDTLDKGWIPEITPGTGQALAVGGIVIGAAAAVGLLVNNRKKDEK